MMTMKMVETCWGYDINLFNRRVYLNVFWRRFESFHVDNNTAIWMLMWNAGPVPQSWKSSTYLTSGHAETSPTHTTAIYSIYILYIYIYIYIYIGCPRRNVPDVGRVFLMLKYTDITQNTYIQIWTVTEIKARDVWNFDSCYTLTDYQIHIKTGRNMWFL